MPTATIITSVFVNTAQAYTRLMGVPQFPYLVCPHPITNVGATGLDETLEAAGPASRPFAAGRNSRLDGFLLP